MPPPEVWSGTEAEDDPVELVVELDEEELVDELLLDVLELLDHALLVQVLVVVGDVH